MNQRCESLHSWTPIQNALDGSTVHASLEKKTISWAYCALFESSSSEPERRLIWRHLNVVICDFAFMLPPERFALTTIVNAHVLNQRFETPFFENKHPFCSNHVWKRWKEHERTPFWIGVLKRCLFRNPAFWNAVYSKISMDATAFCSNHVWKRWFWPQKVKHKTHPKLPSYSLFVNGSRGDRALSRFYSLQTKRATLIISSMRQNDYLILWKSVLPSQTW